MLIGVAKTGEVVEVTPRLLIAGRTLMGTAFGGCRGRTQLPGLIDRYRDGEILVDELVTGNIQLEDEDKWKMSFLMPSKYGSKLPLPKNYVVTIKEVQGRIVVVVAFLG